MRALTPPVGPGRTQFTTGWELERAVEPRSWPSRRSTGLLTVTWERQGDQPEALRGPRPRRPESAQDDGTDVRYQITSVTRDEAAIERLVARMGWQVQVTNVAAARLSLGDSVLGYRGGWAWSGSSTS